MSGNRTLAAFIMVIVACHSAAAAPPAPTAEARAGQSLPLYRLPPADNTDVASRLIREHEYRVTQLQTGEFGKPEDFGATARLLIKMHWQPVVVETRMLPIPTLATESLAPGWRQNGPQFVWRSNVDSSSSLMIPLTGANEARVDLTDFTAVHVEYTAVPDTPVCAPGVMLGAIMRPLRMERTNTWKLVGRTVAPRDLKVLSEILPANAKWREKDLVYLAKKVVGLPADADWRYAQAGPLAVLQRRLHEPLDDVEAIDIALGAKLKIEQVNLMVGRKDGYGAGAVVEISGLPPNQTLPDGRPGARLSIREILQKRFRAEWVENAKDPGKNRFFLQEIIVFVHGDARALTADKPLRQVAFLGPDVRREGGPAHLHLEPLRTVVTNINPLKERLAVDVGGISDLGRPELTEAYLSLMPPAGAGVCAIQVDKVQLLGTYNGAVPAFVAGIETWLRRLGSVDSRDVPQHDRVKHPRLLAFLPLSTLSAGDTWTERNPEYSLEVQQKGSFLLRPIPRAPAKPSYGILAADGQQVTADSRLVANTGARLAASGVMPKVELEGDMLVLGGSAAALSISWPVNVRIDAQTWFHFGAGTELGTVDLTLEASDGRIERRRIEANQPVQLATSDMDIRNVRLEIVPASTPYRLKLRELAFFSMTSSNYVDAMLMPFPGDSTVVPTPIMADGDDRDLKLTPGRILGLLGDEPVRFSTKVDPAMTWFRGLKLNYRLPLTYANDERCPLTVQLEWEKARTERRVCLPNARGSVFIPFANWLGTQDKAVDLGSLRSIQWTLSVPGSKTRGSDESFELAFEVHGIAMVSASDNLRLAPLFSAGGKSILSDSSRPLDLGRDPITRGIWMPLPADSVPLLFKGGMKQSDHWLFAADQIALEPRAPMSRERWVELTKQPPVAPAPARVPRIMLGATLLAAALLALWVGRKRRWWSARGKLAAARSASTSLVRVSKGMLVRAGVLMGRAWRWLNLALGLIAIGPGLWLAGRLGWEFPGVMVFASVLVLEWGVIGLWLRYGSRKLADAPSLRARLAVTALAAGCAIWSLGRYGFTAMALWGFLPLASSAYSFFPALYGMGPSFVSRHRRYVKVAAWVLATAAIYHRGTIVDFGSEKNLWFAVGAFVAVFALRDILLVIAGWVRRWSPATASRLFDSAGGVYFVGAIIALSGATLFIARGWDFPAENFAIVAYYCLLIGTIKEAWALRKSIRERILRGEAP